MQEFKVEVVGYAEPNNGRELREVAIFYQDRDITDQICEKGWPYINFSINKWTLKDATGNFIYIPVEGVSKLVDLVTKRVYNLPYQSVSTVRFQGNVFNKDFLLEIYCDSLILINLKSLRISKYQAFEGQHVESAEIIENEQLKVSYYTHTSEGKSCSDTFLHLNELECLAALSFSQLELDRGGI